MRGNGLDAASFVAIADLDPRIADVMLEVFRDAELAAYVEPCQPSAGVLLEVRLPSAPTDRLYVDEAELERAKRLLDEHLLELSESDEPVEAEDTDVRSTGDLDDAAWQELVRAYESDAETSLVPPWPVVEDTDDTASSESGESSESTGGRAGDRIDDDVEDDSVPGRPAVSTTTTTPADADGFVPPSPPPLPRLDPIAKAGWAGVLGGPALLILATIAGDYVPSWFVPAGLVGFVAGFLTLVVRMRGGPPDESDDGAII